MFGCCGRPSDNGSRVNVASGAKQILRFVSLSELSSVSSTPHCFLLGARLTAH